MNKVVGVLLAGGLARRMGGGDKGLRTLGGKSILSIIIDRTANQVCELLINANGDASRFSEYNLPVTPDVIPDFAGPLAGVLTGMEWTKANHPDVQWVLTIPTDAPFVPINLLEKLMDAVGDDADMACATSAGRTHPVVGLWPVSLAKDLRKAMVEEDMRKVDRWTARYAIKHVDFSVEPIDPFFNANKAEDLVEAEALYKMLEK